MQLPTVFRPTYTPPPMYAWPPAVKRTVLTFSVAAVVVSYLLLAGGLVAALAIFAESMGS